MLTNAADIKTLYAEALKLQQAGEAKEALKRYVQIDTVRPNLPEVHFQLARLFLRTELPQRALPFAQSAAAIRPGEADIWKIYGQVIRTLSDRDAQRTFAKELAKAPLDKRLKGNLSTGTALNGKDTVPMEDLPAEVLSKIIKAVSAESYAEAEALADVALKRFPKSAPLHDIRAVALSGQGKQEAAMVASRQAIRLAPGFAGAWTNYSKILHKAERHGEALAKANAALNLAPGYVIAHVARADAMFGLGRTQEGIADLRRARAADPKNTLIAYKLAVRLLSERELFEARDLVLDAKKHGGSSISMDLLLANILSDLDDTDGALELLQRLAEQTPDNILVQTRLANFFQTEGAFDEAEPIFKKAMELNPNHGDTYRVYLVSKKLDMDDPIIAHMQDRFADAELADVDRAGFGFALAKTMEDNKRYDEVFQYLHPANALYRSHLKVEDHQGANKDDDTLSLESFRSVDWANSPTNDACKAAPIFVTGMPRSGTTLVEQIVGAHSTVTSGGELSVLVTKCKQMLRSRYDRILPLSDIPQSEFEKLGFWYEDYTTALFPGADRITDKSIATYAFVGIIKRAMPNARFVIVRRDPRDNLLSMYKNVFPNGGHEYAYSLSDLARRYKSFVSFVDLWRELTPDWFYEIQYEDLIANPEEESRKLIDACGLQWEDACLDFHRSDNRIKTLSLYQARQPIYKSSSKAWERYGDELNELFEALGPDYIDAAE